MAQGSFIASTDSSVQYLNLKTVGDHRHQQEVLDDMQHIDATAIYI